MALSHVEDSSMSTKRHKPEEIVAKLRQVEVLTAQGRPVAEAIRSIGVTEVAPRRAAQRRDLLYAPGGQDHHRGLAQALQHPSPTLLTGLPAARSRGRAMAGCASPASSATSSCDWASGRWVVIDHTEAPEEIKRLNTPVPASSSARKGL